MVPNDEIRELQEQIQHIEGQIRQLSSDMTELVTFDIGNFVHREIKQRFISHVDFSENLSDDTIRQIKREIASKSKALGERLKTQLQDISLWMIPIPAQHSDSRTIKGNEKVWKLLESIPELAIEILTQYGFPADDPDQLPIYTIPYKPPVYFIKGKYLPSLVEKYWNLLSRYHVLKRELDHLHFELRKQQLTQRWNSIK